MRTSSGSALLFGLTVMSGACGSSSGPGAAVTLTSITPAPGATSVATGTDLTFSFSAPMAAGMEQYLDLHRDSLPGPVVPMTCQWNGARTTLTCIHAPLSDSTTYVMHMGGGLHGTAGGMMDFSTWIGQGGMMLTGTMMGGMHNGQPVGMMGGGWHAGSNYGMGCSFSTS